MAYGAAHALSHNRTPVKPESEWGSPLESKGYFPSVYEKANCAGTPNDNALSGAKSIMYYDTCYNIQQSTSSYEKADCAGTRNDKLSVGAKSIGICCNIHKQQQKPSTGSGTLTKLIAE